MVENCPVCGYFFPNVSGKKSNRRTFCDQVICRSCYDIFICRTRQNDPKEVIGTVHWSVLYCRLTNLCFKKPIKVCFFGQMCEVTPENRAGCAYCFMKKCFAIGLENGRYSKIEDVCAQKPRTKAANGEKCQICRGRFGKKGRSTCLNVLCCEGCYRNFAKCHDQFTQGTLEVFPCVVPVGTGWLHTL